MATSSLELYSRDITLILPQHYQTVRCHECQPESDADVGARCDVFPAAAVNLCLLRKVRKQVNWLNLITHSDTISLACGRNLVIGITSIRREKIYE